MKDVFIIADNIFSPLGSTTNENFDALLQDISAVKEHRNAFANEPYYAALFSGDITFPALTENNNYTKFESLLIASIDEAVKQSGIDVQDNKTLLIISTTKGNISLLESEPYSKQLQQRMALHTSAKLIAGYFGFVNEPLVVSNACISGSLAIITGMRFIQSGKYDNVVVAGADVITKFILSGFKSFQALSNSICKPFDAARDGINLGEAAATVVLSSTKKNNDDIRVISGAISNDANHISGPSRTGNELYQCIATAMNDGGLSKDDIDFISAHGTATMYNDEMEAKAIALAGLTAPPVNSLKAFYGHTLGAAGLVESVISLESLKQNMILPSKGFGVHGVSQPINVCQEIVSKPIRNCIKTASGFGGCNAAIVFSK